MSRILPLLAVAVAVTACAGTPPATEAQQPSATSVTAASDRKSIPDAACVPAGQWADGQGRLLEPRRWLRTLARKPAVLLGELHTDAEHHRWQLQTLAGLHALNPRLAVGMEAFPRRLQPVLDRWVAGALSEADFLEQAEWDKVWGFDAALYWPILHFARMNRLPLIALNVDRALVSRVSREGWAAVPADAREGIADPAPPSSAYRNRLRAVMAEHHLGKAPADAAVNRFIDAQLVWDRAMAQAIAGAHRDTGRTLAAIVGAGHVRYREGIAHQLASLGIKNAAALLPWDHDDDCAALHAAPAVADGVFGLSFNGKPPDQKR